MTAAPDARFLLAHPAHFVALGFGSGLAPSAPGTFGTLVAIPLALLLRDYGNDAMFIAAIAGRLHRRRVGGAGHGARPRRRRPRQHRHRRSRRVPARAVLRRRGAAAARRGLLAVPLLRHRQAAADPAARRRVQERRRRDGRRPARRALYAASSSRSSSGCSGAEMDATLAPIRIEEAGLNALQTQQQLFYDGWLLRVSPGKAKRARSVNAHFGSTLPLDEDRALRSAVRGARPAGAFPHHAVRASGGPRGGACGARVRAVRPDAGAGGAARPVPRTPTLRGASRWKRRRSPSSSTRSARCAARRRSSAQRTSNAWAARRSRRARCWRGSTAGRSPAGRRRWSANSRASTTW